jgi:hypothetical protein
MNMSMLGTALIYQMCLREFGLVPGGKTPTFYDDKEKEGRSCIYRLSK